MDNKPDIHDLLQWVSSGQSSLDQSSVSPFSMNTADRDMDIMRQDYLAIKKEPCLVNLEPLQFPITDVGQSLIFPPTDTERVLLEALANCGQRKQAKLNTLCQVLESNKDLEDGEVKISKLSDGGANAIYVQTSSGDGTRSSGKQGAKSSDIGYVDTSDKGRVKLTAKRGAKTFDKVEAKTSDKGVKFSSDRDITSVEGAKTSDDEGAQASGDQTRTLDEGKKVSGERASRISDEFIAVIQGFNGIRHSDNSMEARSTEGLDIDKIPFAFGDLQDKQGTENMDISNVNLLKTDVSSAKKIKKDSTPPLQNSKRQHLSRSCKSNVSFGTKVVVDDDHHDGNDDDDNGVDDSSWTDNDDDDGAKCEVGSDVTSDRQCSKCGEHHWVKNCDCQIFSVMNDDKSCGKIRYGPSSTDWGRIALPDKPCLKCDEVFVTENLLRIHMNTAHMEGIPSHLCSTCGKGFASTERLTEHMRTHTDERPFFCTVCGKSFKSSATLSHHRRVHTAHGKRKPNPHLAYECTTCAVKFSHRPALREHLNTYEGHRPKNICTLCERIYQGVSSLQKHLATHENGKPFKCEECDASFEFAARLKKHSFKHQTTRDHACPQCKKMYKSDKQLKQHIERVHMTDPKSVLCPVCGKTFKSQFCLTSHTRIYHSADKVVKKEHKCAECEKVFPSAPALWKHSKRHLPTDPRLKCTECHKQFYIAAVFKTHMLCHSEDTPFECEFCGKKFKRPNNLDSHLRTHTGYRIYKCDICDQAFKWAHILRNHIKRHKIGEVIKKQ